MRVLPVVLLLQIFVVLVVERLRGNDAVAAVQSQEDAIDPTSRSRSLKTPRPCRVRQLQFRQELVLVR